MEISLIGQMSVFAVSVGVGAALSLIFDFFRMFELLVQKSEVKIFFADVLYFLICAFISFLYMIVVSCGEIRIFIMIGELVGWLFYHFTVGKQTFCILSKMVFFLNGKKSRIKSFFVKAKVKLKVNKIFKINFVKKKLEKK